MRWTLLIAIVALQGCYYLQATHGQLELLAKREPVERVIAAAGTPADVRERLRLATKARDFAAAELDLPHGGNFTTYADLGRPHALWSVVATPEFSVEPLTWCFPFAGCVAYRGYFGETDARRFADKLAARGHDVRVGGVAAYSTLGWFDDPLLNTMLGGDDLDLVGLVFHELAHRRLYVRDDSAFNEAYATVVEEYGVMRWLESRDQNGRLHEYAARLARRAAFAEAVVATRERLAELYASDLAAVSMRERKRAILDELAAEWPHLDAPNNADLAAVATYREKVPALKELLVGVGGRLAAFYEAAAAFAAQREVPR